MVRLESASIRDMQILRLCSRQLDTHTKIYALASIPLLLLPGTLFYLVWYPNNLCSNQ